MTIRMYRSRLFEEISRDATTVTGYPLDSHTGARTGKPITVPADKVALTGNDQTCADIAAMSESQLLDYVLGNLDYLTDPYYAVFGQAINARHAALRAHTSAA